MLKIPQNLHIIILHIKLLLLCSCTSFSLLTGHVSHVVPDAQSRLYYYGIIIIISSSSSSIIIIIIMVCYDVQIEPALQPITGEELAIGTDQAPDARLDVHCRGFWERQKAAFFDIRVCHPNADSCRDLSPKQIYRIHENEKKRKYNSRVTEIEQGTFTPLAFTATGGMAEECLRYHSRLAELISVKKQKSYATTISWVRAKVSFAILRCALLYIRGSRTPRRRNLDVKDKDLKIAKG